MNSTKKIQMVDLVGQYREIEEEIKEAIEGVILSSAFINGPEVPAFAQELKEYSGSEFVIPCANGTDALQVALMALELKPGDEVVVPAFTYVAPAEVIALLGLKPIFVDVDPDHFNLDPSRIEPVLTKNTKAIIAVHLFGQCSPIESVIELAKSHDLAVIEDNAQAIGADFQWSDGTIRKSGTMADIGTTSFFPSKNLGCYGDGGALTTDNPDLAERLKMICNHGQKTRYYHDCLGVNSRLDTLQAAILRKKLPRLDEYASRRRSVADYYDQQLAGIQGLTVPRRFEFSSHVFHQYTLQVEPKSRQRLMDHLKADGIPSKVYYPVPVHLQKAYRHFGNREGDFPIAEGLCQKVISLPIHTQMDKDQMSCVSESVRRFYHI